MEVITSHIELLNNNLNDSNKETFHTILDFIGPIETLLKVNMVQPDNFQEIVNKLRDLLNVSADQIPIPKIFIAVIVLHIVDCNQYLITNYKKFRGTLLSKINELVEDANYTLNKEYDYTHEMHISFITIAQKLKELCESHIECI